MVSLTLLWLSQSKTLLGKGLINFRILFLKTTKLLEFQRVGSKLFHSMIVKGKKKFKAVVSNVKKEMLSTFLVVYGCFCFSSISLKRY